jgi:hypothetical protein
LMAGLTSISVGLSSQASIPLRSSIRDGLSA